MSLTLKSATTYRTRNGEAAHIAGPARTSEPRFWSLSGNHYTPSGRLVTGYSNTNPCPTNAENEEREMIGQDLASEAPDQSYWIGWNATTNRFEQATPQPKRNVGQPASPMSDPRPLTRNEWLVLRDQNDRGGRKWLDDQMVATIDALYDYLYSTHGYIDGDELDAQTANEIAESYGLL